MAKFSQYEKAKQDFVANGKAQLAKAITNKGVSTPDNASFQVLKNNIDQIKTGPDLSDGLKQWLMTNGTHLEASYTRVGWKTFSVPDNAIVLVRWESTRGVGGQTLDYSIVLDRHQSTLQFLQNSFDQNIEFRFEDVRKNGVLLVKRGMGLTANGGIITPANVIQVYLYVDLISSDYINKAHIYYIN